MLCMLQTNPLHLLCLVTRRALRCYCDSDDKNVITVMEASSVVWCVWCFIVTKYSGLPLENTVFRQEFIEESLLTWAVQEIKIPTFLRSKWGKSVSFLHVHNYHSEFPMFSCVTRFIITNIIPSLSQFHYTKISMCV